MGELEIVREGAVCWLRLNRPEVRNAWTAEMGDAFTAQIEIIARDAAIRAVVITGNGKGFCSGVDLRGHFDVDAEGVTDLRGMHHRRFMPAVLALRRLPKPVICAINGASVGYGCSIAMASDFVLMAKSAVMIIAFARLGLLPDGGATAMLVDRVGPLRTAEIAMLADDISAERALELGLVNQVVADAGLEPAARALAQRLAVTDDFVEGKSAFAERREAHFKGA